MTGALMLEVMEGYFGTTLRECDAKEFGLQVALTSYSLAIACLSRAPSYISVYLTPLTEDHIAVCNRSCFT